MDVRIIIRLEPCRDQIIVRLEACRAPQLAVDALWWLREGGRIRFEGLGFRFWVLGLGLRSFGFRASAVGGAVLGFRFQGSGVRV